MKKNNGADHAERGFSACVLRVGIEKKIRFKILKFSGCVLEYLLKSCQFFCILKFSLVGVCQIKLPQQEPSFR